MGKIFPIFSGKKSEEEISENYNQLLATIVAEAKSAERPGEIHIVNDPEEFIRGKISSFVLDQKMLDLDILRCTLYTAKMIAHNFNNVPESYYATDYFLKGVDDNDPNLILRGADLCFLVCSLFPPRAYRRVMKSADYANLGRQMYYYFYGMTQKTIGLSMGNTFGTMTDIVREVIAH